jgi:hypothetical protein
MEWISVKDRLPEPNVEVLAYRSVDMGGYYKGIHIISYCNCNHISKDTFFVIKDNTLNRNNYRFIKEFTHWMPLPEYP